MKNTCLICNSSSSNFYTLYDDRYGYPGKFTIFKCISCGHISLVNNFSSEFFINLYTNYYPRSTFDLSNYKPYSEAHSFKSWLDGENSNPFRWVPKNVRILDIGCGFAESLGYHKSRGCDVYGVDADENIIRVGTKFDYKVHHGMFDYTLYEENFFDYVTLAQAIEHMNDPIGTLKDIRKILKPGGLLLLSTPNACGWGARIFRHLWINWHVPYHIQWFTISSMNTAAKKSGFMIENLSTITSSTWLHFQWIHLVTYPAESEPSAFWSPIKKRSFFIKFIICVLNIFHSLKVNHLISRFFDAIGKGDNLVFVLRKQ